MRFLLVLCVFLLLLSVVGCSGSGSITSSDTDTGSVLQKPAGDPIDGNDNPEGDPGGAGDGLG